MTIIRSIRANIYIYSYYAAFHSKKHPCIIKVYIYVSSYRPDDGHIIDRNMQSTNKDIL